jgi:hypothetical protein
MRDCRVIGRIGMIENQPSVRMSMSKPAKQCVFCGKTGVTKGHIWPDWLSKVLPRVGTHNEQVVGAVHTFEPKMKGPEFKRVVRPGHAGGRKPRNSCADCNGGWMSRIEQRAKAYATPLIQGTTCALDERGQRALAALLCLITVRTEFAELNTISVSKEDRDWLREKMEPPPLWQIWIARYIGTEPENHWCRHFGMQLVPSPDVKLETPECNTQTTTLVLGQLCAHAFSSSVFPEFSGYKTPLCRIWPLAGWDIFSSALPRVADDDIISLAEALARGMKPIPG